MKIGIAISHHNRHDVLVKTLEQFKQFMPPNAVLEVIDDASDTPTDMATFRFDRNVGIARAKNKGIDLLMKAGCDHLFLFDDDTYPISREWWKPYVESQEPHLMYNFTEYSDGSAVGDCNVVYEDKNIRAQGHPRGCMLYVAKGVVERVGGFNVEFGKAMEEHVEYSQRIWNAGLTRFKYADVINSRELIYSTDWDRPVGLKTSIDSRWLNLKKNRELLAKLKHDSSFQPYDNDNLGKRAVITTYFTCGVDVQRNRTWQADRNAIMPLVESVVNHGEKIVILNDCGWDEVDGLIEWKNIESYGNPYFWRWYAEYLYLRDSDLDTAWLVDATDVQMLENPFDQMEAGILYSGDERGTMQGNRWMLENTKTNVVRRALVNANRTILNCGVVGGSKRQLMELTQGIWDLYCETGNIYEVEMPLYNYYLLDKAVTHGAPVNTRFKHFETEGAWWKHK